MPATCPHPEPARSSPCPSFHFLKINFNIILPSTSGCHQRSLSLRFPHQKPVDTSPLAHTCYMLLPSHSSRFDHPNKTGWGVQILWSFKRVQPRYKHMHRIGLWAAIRNMSTSVTTLRECTNASTLNFTQMMWQLLWGTAVGWLKELIWRFYSVVLFLFYSWSGRIQKTGLLKFTVFMSCYTSFRFSLPYTVFPHP